MTQKRFQYWSRDGIKWTNWFPYDGEPVKKQLGKLINEYREV